MYTLKIIFRNLTRHKFFFILNGLGLILSFIAFLTIRQYTNYHYSFEKIHENEDRIYRINRTDSTKGKTWASSYAWLNPILKNEVSQVENATTIHASSGAIGRPGEDSNIKTNNLVFTDDQFFEIFTVPVVKRSKSMLLSFPNEIVLSENASNILFQGKDPLNQVLIYTDKNFGRKELTVVGVTKNMPDQTHVTPDYLISLSTTSFGTSKIMDLPWTAFYNYVKVKPGVKSEWLTGSIENIKNKEDESSEYFVAQALADIHTNNEIENELSPTISSRLLTFFDFLALFILSLAILNYLNFALSNYISRLKNDLVRKIHGACSLDILKYYIKESVFICSLFLILAIGLYYYLAPFIYQFLGIPQTKSQLLNIYLISESAIAVILIAASASFIPLFVVKRIPITAALKSRSFNYTHLGNGRKILVGSQFGIIFLMVAVSMLFNDQIKFMINSNLGFTPKNVVVISRPIISSDLDRSNREVFKDYLKKNPNVKSFTTSATTPGDTYNYGASLVKHKGEQSNVEYYATNVDETYFSHYEIELLAGRFFQADLNEKRNIILSQEAVKNLGYANSSEIVGETVWLDNELQTVIGVSANYSHRGFKNRIDPIVFIPSARASQFSVRFNSKAGLQTTLEDINIKFLELFPNSSFGYTFLQDTYNQLYMSDFQLRNILWVFSVVALVLAVFSLLGTSSFEVKRRAKEVTIRKILGAMPHQIFWLLSKSFLKFTLIVPVILTPFLYLIFDKILQQFSQTIEISYLKYTTIPLGLCIILTILVSLIFTSKLSVKPSVSALSDI